MTDDLAVAGRVVESLARTMRDSEHGISAFPALLRRVINEGLWVARRVDRLGQVVTFDRFEDFVTTPPLEGLGADLRTLRNICRDDVEALDALDRATRGKQGKRTDLVDNSNEDRSQGRPTGTARDQALRRLRKDRPDLHSRVLAGELSAHGAMVEAGFRPKTVTVRLSVEGFAKAIRRHLKGDAMRELARRLGKS